MTRTRMSRDMATIILRTVSAAAASPYLTLSSLVTPSTRAATSSPNSRRSSTSVYAVSSTVSCSSAAQMVSWFMPSSARIVATASGWVMYGSPLRRFWPACQCAATSYARSMSRMSALGWVARTVLVRGSSTGFTPPPRGAPRRARRRRTAAPPLVPGAGVGDGPTGAGGSADVPGGPAGVPALAGPEEAPRAGSSAAGLPGAGATGPGTAASRVTSSSSPGTAGGSCCPWADGVMSVPTLPVIVTSPATYAPVVRQEPILSAASPAIRLAQPVWRGGGAPLRGGDLRHPWDGQEVKPPAGTADSRPP